MMCKIYNLCLILLLFCACGSSNAIDHAKQDSAETIIPGCGYQVVNLTNQPIANAKFIITHIQDNHDRRVREGLSDKDGIIRILPEDPENAKLSIVVPGFESQDLQINPQSTTIKKIKFTPSTSYSIVSYNVLKGFENNESKKSSFINWLKDYDPDFMLFQEMNYYTEEKLAEFAKRYGHPYSALLKEKGYPTAFSSKFPIESVERVTEGQTHGYLHVKCKDIHFFICHLSPRTLAARVAEIQSIIKDIESLGKNAKVIVAGDLNSYNKYDAQSYGPDFITDRKKFKPTVEVDFTVTNLLIDAGFTDSYAYNRTTFKPTIPVTPDYNHEDRGFRYDYIYVNRNLVNGVRYSDIIRDTATDQLSDHYPLTLRLLCE